MMNIKKLEGSITTDMFFEGLLRSGRGVTYGSIWEKCVKCEHCLFAKQCRAIDDYYTEQDKNPRCGQIVDLLMGELKAEDIK